MGNTLNSQVVATGETANTDQSNTEGNNESNTINLAPAENNSTSAPAEQGTPAQENEPEDDFNEEEFVKGIVTVVTEVFQENTLVQKRNQLQEAFTKLLNLYQDKSTLCNGFDRQNQALINQISSLKSVVAITKDLLTLRNMEVEHLQRDLNVMEENINAERERQKLLLEKLSCALNLNEQLKTEYLKQQGLFQGLREKYMEKIELLTRENRRLQALANGEAPPEPEPEVQKSSEAEENAVSTEAPEEKSQEETTPVVPQEEAAPAVPVVPQEEPAPAVPVVPQEEAAPAVPVAPQVLKSDATPIIENPEPITNPEPEKSTNEGETPQATELPAAPQENPAPPESSPASTDAPPS